MTQSVPPSPETTHALVSHVALVVERIDKRQESLEDRIEEKIERLAEKERGLRRIADDLSSVALKLHMAHLIGKIAPTPARLAFVAALAFLGGFTAQLALAWAGLR